MADLSLEMSREFWKNFTDPRVFEVINIMEKIETWTLDGNETIEEALNQLESALDLAEGSEELDTSCPGAASRLLSYAESEDYDNKAAQLFIRRNLIFERLRLLSRIFCSENLQTIQEALEDHS